MKLEQMKIIVTGAAQGMGRHFSLRLAEAGAQVAAGDIRQDALASLVEESKALRGKVHARAVDVTQEESIVAFTAWARGAMGGLNGLINNAGILRDKLLVKKDRTTGEITKMSLEEWRAVIDVNLTGATLMARETIASMVTNGERGVVINMSSIAKIGNRGQSNYVAAKAALAANTRTWALEAAPFGIRVGAVAPGMIETPMTQGMKQAARDALVASVPVGRIGTPEDIWQAVRFIIECDYFNARTVEVDGGLAM
jgi:3-oxoacyl-[acyl-carrier protein] reductase